MQKSRRYGGGTLTESDNRLTLAGAANRRRLADRTDLRRR